MVQDGHAWSYMVKYGHIWSSIFVQVYNSASVQVCKCASVQVCKCVSVQVCKCANIWKIGNIWKFNCLEWTCMKLIALRSYARMCLFPSKLFLGIWNSLWFTFTNMNTILHQTLAFPRICTLSNIDLDKFGLISFCLNMEWVHWLTLTLFYIPHIMWEMYIFHNNK